MVSENGYHRITGSLPTSLRYWFLFAVVAVATFILYAMNSGSELLILSNAHFNTHWGYEQSFHIQTSNSFAINTPGCSIPELNPFDESIIQYAVYPKKLKACSQSNQTLLEQNNTHVWINKKNLAAYKIKGKSLFCCYQSFYRPYAVEDVRSFKVDDRLRFNECVYFFDIIQANDEFVKITCNIGKKKIVSQYFLFVHKRNVTTLPRRNTSLPYNVVVMGIDGVSRQNFYRTMPKTLKFLKNKGAVELYGYNKVGDNTFPNLVPMLMGISENELKGTCLPRINNTFDNCPILWNWYKEAGFATAFGEDSGWLGTFNYGKRGFINTPTDFYLRTFIREAEKSAGKNKDVNSYLCMNHRFFYKVLLEYIERLSQVATDPKMFALFWEISMSHDHLTYPMVIDDSYEMFFEKIYSTGYLNKTILFLLSDHGIRWGKIRLTKQGRLEERMPFVFILTPQSFKKSYSIASDNLNINSRRLTTPYDIHATLYDLINLSNIKDEAIIARASQQYASNRSISLWMQVPENRTCATASIEEHWCTCHRGVRVGVESGVALEAGGTLVNTINGMLRGHAACARLRLAGVLEATELVAGGGGAADWREYLLVVRTAPGGGVFEATLRRRAERWQLAGTVSRLNLYADQSRCMHHYHLKLYCYCI